MKNIVAGTAGHIDHGKTALVRALTGIDTDRLEEEKRRGISIDLGFAHMDLTQDLRIAFVDVPGHEKFVKNMLAGVGGVDLIVLVISADESIKPQTREHFEICRLLNIRTGMIVLTKADLVDEEILELVKMEVEEFVAGSFLDGAPMVPVSVVTGQGIEQLRAALTEASSRISEKDQSQYFRLPIDRSFVMRGFGTVVTGTLLAGSVVPEQEVETYPGEHRLRIRGVQVHGQAAIKATAGQRTALNIAGAEQADLSRGMMLADPGRFRLTREVDCAFELLASAKPLKHRAPVHFHSGTAETLAHLHTLESTEGVKPGTRSFTRFVLAEPLLLLPGDRFIVRMFSPVVTIGGGVVLDIDRPGKLKRPQAVERLKTLADGGLTQRIALLVKESAFGMGLPDLVARTGARAEAIEKAISKDITAIREPQPWFVNPDWFQSTLKRWRSLLAGFHRNHPLLPGMPREELRSRELPDAPPFLFETLLAADNKIVKSGEVLHLATHKLALKQDEEEALTRIEAAFEKGGLAVPSMQEVLAASGVEAGRARSLLQILLRNKSLVKIGDELVYHNSALNTLKSLLAERKGRRFGVADFKDWTGVSRKYAIPLLEHLDRERVTRREGDSRVIL